MGKTGDAPFIRRRIGKENRASYVVSINSSIKNHWYEPARDINDCLSMLRFAAHFAARTNRAIKDLFASTMDLNAQRFCLPYLNAQMVKLFAIHDNVAQMANYVAQMSQLLAIQNNQHCESAVLNHFAINSTSTGLADSDFGGGPISGVRSRYGRK